MKKCNPNYISVLFKTLLLAGVCFYSSFAHNVSWNKAVVRVEERKITLQLRISQFDLLDTIAPGRWKEMYRNEELWRGLLPEIRHYAFNNVEIIVDSTLLTRGSDLAWRLEHVYPTEEVPADTNLGILEISRSWDIDTVPEHIVMRLNLLKNCSVPVKWVVLLKSDYTVARVYPHIVNRGDVACYDFRKQAWIVNADNPGGFRRAITQGVQNVWRWVTGKKR